MSAPERQQTLPTWAWALDHAFFADCGELPVVQPLGPGPDDTLWYYTPGHDTSLEQFVAACFRQFGVFGKPKRAWLKGTGEFWGEGELVTPEELEQILYEPTEGARPVLLIDIFDEGYCDVSAALQDAVATPGTAVSRARDGKATPVAPNPTGATHD